MTAISLTRLVDPDPLILPVTLEEAKAHLRVLDTMQDAEITAYLMAAIGVIDGRYGCLGRCLVTQQWELIRGWQSDRYLPIKLPLGPLISVDYVTCKLEENIWTVLTEGTDFIVDTGTHIPAIRPMDCQRWPLTLKADQAWRLQYTVGYGAVADNIPAPIKQAILLLTEHFFANRSASTDMKFEELPMGVKGLLANYRIRSLGALYD